MNLTLGKSSFFPKLLHQLRLGFDVGIYILIHSSFGQEGHHLHSVLLAWSLYAGYGLPVVIGVPVCGVEHDQVGLLEVQACAARVNLQNDDVHLALLEVSLNLLSVFRVPIVLHSSLGKFLLEFSFQEPDFLHEVAEDNYWVLSVPEVVYGQVQLVSPELDQLPTVQSDESPRQLVQSHNLGDGHITGGDIKVVLSLQQQ